MVNYSILFYSPTPPSHKHVLSREFFVIDEMSAQYLSQLVTVQGLLLATFTSLSILEMSYAKLYFSILSLASSEGKNIASPPGVFVQYVKGLFISGALIGKTNWVEALIAVGKKGIKLTPLQRELVAIRKEAENFCFNVERAGRTASNKEATITAAEPLATTAVDRSAEESSDGDLQEGARTSTPRACKTNGAAPSPLLPLLFLLK